MAHHLFIALVALEAYVGALGVRSEEDDTKSLFGQGHFEDHTQKHFDKLVHRHAKKTLNDTGQDDLDSLEERVATSRIDKGNTVYVSARAPYLVNGKIAVRAVGKDADKGIDFLSLGDPGIAKQPLGMGDGKWCCFWVMDFGGIDYEVLDVQVDTKPQLSARTWTPGRGHGRQQRVRHAHHQRSGQLRPKRYRPQAPLAHQPPNLPGAWHWLSRGTWYKWEEPEALHLPRPDDPTFPWGQPMQYTERSQHYSCKFYKSPTGKWQGQQKNLDSGRERWLQWRV